ncbi:DNA repair protein RecN [Qingshengfaniella alkalisoli]|uniref:DNA repair protein RecN n=1 Tax=Qingshengfaniella alkalisoli TaxID=2599296 RepID=A0A5B8IV12_9RHOB|nr:DNA repair protein RecN [Qingshengfaniella alkalisoli]QDY69444.1 DNA repair protein RecN [Qingshengfaniella alkalisoli]
MILELEIRNILLIDHLEIEFRSGLNVLTGETGAGKSILLDSLGFVLGWRGRADIVRQGAEQGEVTAIFALSDDHPARAVLAEAEIPVEDDLILRRVNRADGRKTAWVNDRRCSGDILRNLSDTLVELQGQRDDRGLLDAKGHRALLDSFAGNGTLLADTRSAWTDLVSSRRFMQGLEAAVAKARDEEEFLRHAVQELDDLSPEPGEDAALDAKRRLMQNAEKVRQDVERVVQALDHSEGAEGRITDAVRWLESVAGNLPDDAVSGPLAALERVAIELSEAQSGVEQVLAQLSFDPEELLATEERLFALRGLSRKHGVPSDDLAAFADELRARLDRIETADTELEQATRSVAMAERAYADAAAKLSEARQGAAGRLDTAMQAQLAPLKMERARFVTQVTGIASGPDGVDAVEFQVATNPGSPAGPMQKVASGGELSRFLLALKVCLSGDDGTKTLIFDEIDQGVGGATADAVGKRLAQLAQSGQVLVVTHSPQVAAYGQQHLRVEKRVEGETTLSHVEVVAAHERVAEIARMVSGDQVTDAARAAANALIDRASQELS